MARTADRKTILELFAFAKENEAADDDASSSSNNSDAENTVRVVFTPLTFAANALGHSSVLTGRV